MGISWKDVPTRGFVINLVSDPVRVCAELQPRTKFRMQNQELSNQAVKSLREFGVAVGTLLKPIVFSEWSTADIQPACRAFLRHCNRGMRRPSGIAFVDLAAVAMLARKKQRRPRPDAFLTSIMSAAQSAPISAMTHEYKKRFVTTIPELLLCVRHAYIAPHEADFWQWMWCTCTSVLACIPIVASLESAE